MEKSVAEHWHRQATEILFFCTIFVGPRKNGTRLFHIELIAEASAKHLMKRPKIGESVEWYDYKEPDNNKLEVEEEE